MTFNGMGHNDLEVAACEKRCYELQRLLNQQQAQLDYQHRKLGDIAEDLQNLRKLLNKLIEE